MEEEEEYKEKEYKEKEYKEGNNIVVAMNPIVTKAKKNERERDLRQSKTFA